MKRERTLSDPRNGKQSKEMSVTVNNNQLRTSSQIQLVPKSVVSDSALQKSLQTKTTNLITYVHHIA